MRVQGFGALLRRIQLLEQRVGVLFLGLFLHGGGIVGARGGDFALQGRRALEVGFDHPLGGGQERLRVGGAVDVGHVGQAQLGQAGDHVARHLLDLVSLCIGARAQHPAQPVADVRAEQPPEDFLALAGFGQQQIEELALRQHGHLLELRIIQPDERFDLLPHLAVVLDGQAAGHGQADARGLRTRALAIAQRPLIAGRTADVIGLAAVLECEIDISRVIWQGVIAAHATAGSALVGHAAIERVGDRVEYRGLARAGVAGDQEHAALAKFRKVNRGLVGVGAEHGHGELERSHAFSSSRASASALFTSSVSSGLSGCPAASS